MTTKDLLKRENIELKETINYITDILLQQLEYGQNSIQDCKDNNLILNQLESEGYTRACLAFKNIFSEYNSMLNKLLNKGKINE